MTDATYHHPVNRDTHPIIPAWVRDPNARRATIKWAHQTGTHWTLFHTARIPLYTARILIRAPTGMGHTIRGTCAWVADTKGDADREALRSSVQADSVGANPLWKMSERHRRTVQVRSALALSAVLSIGYMWSHLTGPDLILSAVLSPVLSVVTFGVIGRKPDKPLLDRAADTAIVPKPTPDTVTASLAAAVATIGRAVKRDGPEAVKYVAPITRDGLGWRADIDLPPGVTATEVIRAREALASGLRRPLSCVWPEAVPKDQGHTGRLILFVSDQPLTANGVTDWPLAHEGVTNVFAPVPIGVDPRGRPVEVTLMFASGLIGAVSRMGKTFLLRLITLAAAGDPRVEVHVYDFKGGGDMTPLRHVAHTFRAGDDIQDVEALVHDLTDLGVEVRRRYGVLGALPSSICPEAKLTDDLANRPGLHPIFFVIDECQVAFAHPVHGKTLDALTKDLMRRAPAVGVMIWFATHRADTEDIPAAVAAGAVLRFALKVIGHVPNDMILGTGAYKDGYRATEFDRDDVGIALMAGGTPRPVVLKGAYVDNVQADTIAKRFRADRIACGRLSGLAAGQDPAPDNSTASILDRVLDVWPVGQDKVWSETLADLLAARWPDTYGDWTAERVTTALAPHGVPSVQVKRDRVNRRGIANDAVVRAVTDRALDAVAADSDPDTGQDTDKEKDA